MLLKSTRLELLSTKFDWFKISIVILHFNGIGDQLIDTSVVVNWKKSFVSELLVPLDPASPVAI